MLTWFPPLCIKQEHVIGSEAGSAYNRVQTLRRTPSLVTCAVTRACLPAVLVSLTGLTAAGVEHLTIAQTEHMDML
jgi:hypothetical protein